MAAAPSVKFTELRQVRRSNGGRKCERKEALQNKILYIRININASIFIPNSSCIYSSFIYKSRCYMDITFKIKVLQLNIPVSVGL